MGSESEERPIEVSEPPITSISVPRWRDAPALGQGLPRSLPGRLGEVSPAEGHQTLAQLIDRVWIEDDGRVSVSLHPAISDHQARHRRL